MKELINRLEELNRQAEKGGGDARIEKQHSDRKLTATLNVSTCFWRKDRLLNSINW